MMIPGIHMLPSFVERIEGPTLTMWTVPSDIGPIDSFSRRQEWVYRGNGFVLHRIIYSKTTCARL